jgi:hypothetical protein
MEMMRMTLLLDVNSFLIDEVFALFAFVATYPLDASTTESWPFRMLHLRQRMSDRGAAMGSGGSSWPVPWYDSTYSLFVVVHVVQKVNIA